MIFSPSLFPFSVRYALLPLLVLSLLKLVRLVLMALLVWLLVLCRCCQLVTRARAHPTGDPSAAEHDLPRIDGKGALWPSLLDCVTSIY